SRELFEEGLHIPLCKFQKRGELNDELMRVILANVRLPEQVLGDIHAQLGCLEVGEARLNDFLDDVGADDPEPVFDAIEKRSERAMREAIEAVPDGTYRESVEIDGIDGRPLTLEVAVQVEGDRIHVDWSGSSPQCDRGINETYNHAYAMT